MRSLTTLQWLGATATAQLVAAAGLAGVGFHSPAPSTKVLGVSTAKADKVNGEDKKDILAGGAIEGLYPGAVLDLPVVLQNRNNFAVVVTSIETRVEHATTGCPADNVRVDDFAGRKRVEANSSSVQNVTVRLRNDAPNECKNVVWPLTYSGRAVKP